MTKNKLNAWVHAIRLRTLPLAFSSSLLGSFIAYFDQSFKWSVLWMALLTTLFLQILSNLANDYGDSKNGADNSERVGPQRAVQSGIITAKEMRIAVIMTSLLAFISGILLIGAGIGFSVSLKWLMFLLLGIGALGAAINYTVGKKPYGYMGFGDLFVFLFFGLTGVLGTYYLHTGQFYAGLLLPATAMGLLSTAVLNLNNMRDVEGDGRAGKRTLVVIMGPSMARVYHLLLIIGAPLALTGYTLLNYRGPGQFIFLITLPVLLLHLKVVFSTKEPSALDPQLKRLALTTFATVIIFGFGMII
ncbi:MAG TPA: 1,4-dihydroxy-2-naphthoate polyprenyltransferase [Lentimicrobium sp.]|nr:1,4-dihydroxy-2-naphthoate polyprenyltransferase [Lentimicrobium sp.]